MIVSSEGTNVSSEDTDVPSEGKGIFGVGLWRAGLRPALFGCGEVATGRRAPAAGGGGQRPVFFGMPAGLPFSKGFWR